MNKLGPVKMWYNSYNHLWRTGRVYYQIVDETTGQLCITDMHVAALCDAMTHIEMVSNVRFELYSTYHNDRHELSGNYIRIRSKSINAVDSKNLTSSNTNTTVATAAPASIATAAPASIVASVSEATVATPMPPAKVAETLAASVSELVKSFKGRVINKINVMPPLVLVGNTYEEAVVEILEALLVILGCIPPDEVTTRAQRHLSRTMLAPDEIAHLHELYGRAVDKE